MTIAPLEGSDRAPVPAPRAEPLALSTAVAATADSDPGPLGEQVGCFPATGGLFSEAVRALIFLARRIQPFLSPVDREVEFCVLTI